ncbi:MAG: hypothetical protein R3D89_08775 [Sphingomonadaceae bacterium]
MASGIPPASEFSGLSRKVIEYGEAFEALVAKAKSGLTDADWAPLEALVDVDNWERLGTFLGPAETSSWADYKALVTNYAGNSTWDGTLRHLTEQGNRVIQELTEYNARDGVTNVSNTVTVFEFNDAGKIVHLDVYVMHLEDRPA